MSFWGKQAKQQTSNHTYTRTAAHIRCVQEKRDIHDEKGHGNGNESKRWKMDGDENILRQWKNWRGRKRKLERKKNYGMKFECVHVRQSCLLVWVCVCVYVEQQSKDPHNLKFKFQQFTWIYHEIQFMAMFLVFGVHITKSLVPSSFTLSTKPPVSFSLGVCVCACYSVSLTNELLAIYLAYRCAHLCITVCVLYIWMGNVCTLRMPALMCIMYANSYWHNGQTYAHKHTHNRIMCERGQQKNCTTIHQVIGA